MRVWLRAAGAPINQVARARQSSRASKRAAARLRPPAHTFDTQSRKNPRAKLFIIRGNYTLIKVICVVYTTQNMKGQRIWVAHLIPNHLIPRNFAAILTGEFESARSCIGNSRRSSARCKWIRPSVRFDTSAMGTRVASKGWGGAQVVGGCASASLFNLRCANPNPNAQQLRTHQCGSST